MDERPGQTTGRELGPRAAGPGRIIYCAGAVALTEPGPAAVGVVVTNQRGIPCKHLLAVARQADAMDRVFYPAAPGGR